MNGKYLIGLEGGGTKTKCVLTDYELNPLYECQGGPTNFLILGTRKASETILELIVQSMNHLQISTNEIESIFIGTTGAGRESDAQKLKNDFINYADSKDFTFKSFNVDSDARIALEGAFSGKPGSLLIAGTGSVIFGKDKNNVLHRAGGFGRFIGDEGSGYSIGRKGLSSVAKEFDGRGEKSELTKILGRDFGITNSSQLITEIYSNNFDIASFAPIVIEAAEKGDEPAQKILHEESNELIQHAKTMYALLKEKSMKLCMVGGLIENKNYYSDLFKSKLEVRLPAIEIIAAENPPVTGAAYMAKTNMLI